MTTETFKVGSLITNVLLKPLNLYWKPKEDITVFELSLCLPFLLRAKAVMPYEIDKNATHFRHFEIIDPNSISVSTTANEESNKNETSEQKGFDIPTNSCQFLPPDPNKNYCTFPIPNKSYCTFPDPSKSYCTFPDLSHVENTFKDSAEPISILNTSTSNAVVDLDNPLTKPTGL
jgi:hypothetical protein